MGAYGTRSIFGNMELIVWSDYGKSSGDPWKKSWGIWQEVRRGLVSIAKGQGMDLDSLEPLWEREMRACDGGMLYYCTIEVLR